MANGVFVIVLTGLLTSCAGQSKRQEAQLAQLLDWLPGQYDNREQAEADARVGSGAHTALALSIVPIYAPMIGDHVYYLQESAADDSRRVMSQRVISFEVTKDSGIVQSLWSLAEPDRWRDAHLNPDLFKGLMPQDFTPLAGCDLLWTQEEALFVGANDATHCAVSGRGGERLHMGMRAELGADRLALADQSFDAAGRLVQGEAAEPFYRFRKR